MALNVKLMKDLDLQGRRTEPRRRAEDPHDLADDPGLLGDRKLDPGHSPHPPSELLNRVRLDP